MQTVYKIHLLTEFYDIHLKAWRVLNKKKVTVPESLLLNIHIVSLLLMGVARARIPQFFQKGGGPRVSIIVYVMLFSI